MTLSKTIDISSRSTGLEKRLSNFMPYEFVIDEVKCGSMEGFLQSLKFRDPERQIAVASCVGYSAMKKGRKADSWKLRQILFWRGVEYGRSSQEYGDLVRRAYLSMATESESFRNALRASSGFRLEHSMGKSDPTDTVLTRREFVEHLEHVRGSLA